MIYKLMYSFVSYKPDPKSQKIKFNLYVHCPNPEYRSPNPGSYPFIRNPFSSSVNIQPTILPGLIFSK